MKFITVKVGILLTLSWWLFTKDVNGQAVQCQENNRPPVEIGKTRDIFIRVTTCVDGPYSSRFLVVHNNENVARESVKAHITKYGGTLIELRHPRGRYVRFTSSDRDVRGWVEIDPNRIFPSSAGIDKDKGIKDTLNEKYKKNAVIIGEVRILQKAILRELEGVSPVIAVHNNNNDDGDGKSGHLSIRSYDKSYGNSEGKDGNTRLLEGEKNPVIIDKEVDNYFLVTDKGDFDRLKSKYNVVLQSQNNDSDQPDRKGPNQDGSLSVYFKDARYIILEVQHDQHTVNGVEIGKYYSKDRDGKAQEYQKVQEQMLLDLEKAIRGGSLN